MVLEFEFLEKKGGNKAVILKSIPREEKDRKKTEARGISERRR